MSGHRYPHLRSFDQLSLHHEPVHIPKHRGMSDEEYLAERWRRVELAVRR